MPCWGGRSERWRVKNLERLTEIAQANARAHIEPLGLSLTVEAYEGGVTLDLKDGKEWHRDYIRLDNMPVAVQEEYVHCRVHALAAKLIARRYPT